MQPLRASPRHAVARGRADGRRIGELGVKDHIARQVGPAGVAAGRDAAVLEPGARSLKVVERLALVHEPVGLLVHVDGRVGARARGPHVKADTRLLARLFQRHVGQLERERVEAVGRRADLEAHEQGVALVVGRAELHVLDLAWPHEIVHELLVGHKVAGGQHHAPGHLGIHVFAGGVHRTHAQDLPIAIHGIADTALCSGLCALAHRALARLVQQFSWIAVVTGSYTSCWAAVS